MRARDGARWLSLAVETAVALATIGTGRWHPEAAAVGIIALSSAILSYGLYPGSSAQARRNGESR
jgi:hypothetical protein